jgi:4-oxalocrotonate tautomerase
MPTLHVQLFEGRSVEVRRALAKALTETSVRVLGGSADGADVLFHDISRHDRASGGILWRDKLASAPTADGTR